MSMNQESIIHMSHMSIICQLIKSQSIICLSNVTPCKKSRVGQDRTYTPYMTVYLVISLPKLPYIHRIYMVLANPTDEETSSPGKMRKARVRCKVSPCKV